MDNLISKRKQATKIAYEKGYRIIGGELYNPKGVLLKGSIRKTKGVSYRMFSLKWPAKIFKKKSASITYHFLVAFEKFGDRFFQENIHVRHLNGNSFDNSHENIDIGTPLENSMDRLPLERKIHAVKTAWHNRKFSDEQVKQIRVDREGGMSYNKLAAKYNVNKSTLSFLFNESIYYKYPSLDSAIEAITKEFSEKSDVAK